MDSRKQRIAIAMAVGWKFQEGGDCGGTYLRRGWFTPDGAFFSHCPDYPNDLNAMHEAEKTIAGKVEQSNFAHALIEVLNQQRRGDVQFLGASPFDQMHATAAQRAEAFLRALNLWTE